MSGERGIGSRNMSTIDDVIHFFEMEIAYTEHNIEEKSNLYNGVKVGIKESHDLRRKHIKYCQNIIDRIRSNDL